MSATICDGIHHGAHADHRSTVPTLSSTASGNLNFEGDAHHVDPQTIFGTLAHLHHADHDGATNPSNPTPPSDGGSADLDCVSCCAAHCFAGLMPAVALIPAPWPLSKKITAAGLFAAAPPTWRLERPPKIAL
ncbi:MAG: hypothetical protein K0U34_00155 [Alphaproteobacteria bacterium]|nr:hypothetical protein [Alphaproteobacteria bacterium]